MEREKDFATLHWWKSVNIFILIDLVQKSFYSLKENTNQTLACQDIGVKKAFIDLFGEFEVAKGHEIETLVAVRYSEAIESCINER